jgi:hypothetical protein
MQRTRKADWFEDAAAGAEFWADDAEVQIILAQLDFNIAGYAVTCENGALADAAGDIEADLYRVRNDAVRHYDDIAADALDDIAPCIETVIERYIEAKLVSLVAA